MIYLDHSASTRPYDEVINRMSDILQKSYANPSSLYDLAIEAEKIINQSLQIISDDLHCKRQNLIITSSATESINSVYDFVRRRFRDKGIVACTSVDHAASIESAKRLEKEGFNIEYMPVNSIGCIEEDYFISLLNRKPILINIIMVNNETGVVNDIKKLVSYKNQYSPKTLINIDAVQAWKKIPLDLESLSVDFATFSGHKVHGPKGIGLLYVRDVNKYEPFIIGGGQQRNLRSGTENPVLIAGLAEAIKVQSRQSLSLSMNRVAELRTYLLEKIKNMSTIPFIINEGVLNKSQIANIISLSIPGARAETLLHFMEGEKIYLSSGSACHSSSKSGSHVLLAMGLNRECINGTIRISLDFNNTEEEIDIFVEKLEKALRQMRVIK